mgnify:FL=1|tara:strand:+ start:543 stop:1352 length:810 start_codon:yes stop_codon:yes gene_type:complete
MNDNLFDSPWVQSPQIPSVQQLIKTVEPVNYPRGSGQARQRLDLLEQKYRAWVSDCIDLAQFKHCYFVNGVTDALNQWIATESRPWQYLKGDYEYARMIGGKGECVDEIQPDKLLYISNPACATGNVIELDKIENDVILDCAYVGTTSKHQILPPKNTEQIWFSFSKGWGLIGQRSGLVFSKRPHRSLNIMKRVEAWNYTSVEICLAILANYDIDTVYNEYRQKQIDVCTEMNLTPSDCFFIANSTHEEYAKRRRTGNIARLDLSKLLR